MAIGMFLLAISVVVAVTSTLDKRSARRATAAARGATPIAEDLGLRAFKHQMEAASRMVRQLAPPTGETPYEFEYIKREFFIDGDGTTQVENVFHIKAYKYTLHYWTFVFGAEPLADAVNYLEELRFKISDDQDESKVTYLISRNDTHRKEVRVFFLPPILVGETARKVHLSFTWPRMTKQLLGTGQENFQTRLESHGLVAQFEYGIYLGEGLHSRKDITCEHLEPSLPSSEMKPIGAQYAGRTWTGWRYRATNAPAGKTAYEFSLKAADRRN